MGVADSPRRAAVVATVLMPPHPWRRGAARGPEDCASNGTVDRPGCVRIGSYGITPLRRARPAGVLDGIDALR